MSRSDRIFGRNIDWPRMFAHDLHADDALLERQLKRHQRNRSTI